MCKCPNCGSSEVLLIYNKVKFLVMTRGYKCNKCNSKWEDHDF